MPLIHSLMIDIAVRLVTWSSISLRLLYHSIPLLYCHWFVYSVAGLQLQKGHCKAVGGRGPVTRS